VVIYVIVHLCKSANLASVLQVSAFTRKDTRPISSGYRTCPKVAGDGHRRIESFLSLVPSTLS
jgi:hypothetical protein